LMDLLEEYQRNLWLPIFNFLSSFFAQKFLTSRIREN
jgi:hypothetical protein